MSKFNNYTCCSLLSFVLLIIHGLVEGKTISNPDHAFIIKTIKSDNDEIIDCYDIHRQPSLNNPLFRDHMIQMRPSSYPKGIKSNEQGNLKLTQNWHNYGLCPEKTVPIPRNNPTLSSKHFHPSSSDGANEFAIMTPEGDIFQGSQATINLWKPLVEGPNELSSSQIWISSGGIEEVIEAGWEVNTNLYGDEEPRFFLYWTADEFKSTGCYNMQCPGFVQTTSKVSLGATFSPISIFNGDQFDATFVLFREQSTGNWWVQLQGVDIGYWPNFLFKQLSVKATRTDFGGQIYNSRPNGRHTNTQMGNGHFPSEGGYGISSYIRKVQVFDGNYEAKVPERVFISKTNASCYDLELGQTDSSGVSFFFGGLGFSGTCQ